MFGKSATTKKCFILLHVGNSTKKSQELTENGRPISLQMFLWLGHYVDGHLMNN